MIEQFPARLRQLREQAHLTQEGLARLAGLTSKHVSGIELGKVGSVGWGVVCRLADALGVSVEEFRDSTPPAKK